METLRCLIKEELPGVTEGISYNIPAFGYEKTLVYYAAFKNHIGFYPLPGATAKFAAALEGYTRCKAGFHIRHHQAIPQTLIKKMLHYRCREVEVDLIAARTRKSGKSAKLQVKPNGRGGK